MDATTIRYRGRGMGKVIVRVKITNLMDRIEADMKEKQEAAVRSLTADNAIVDTGANRLCLPAPMIRALGLQPIKEIDMKTAGNIVRTRLYRWVVLSICGREDVFSCLELPTAKNVLIGVSPLEVLGLEPDLQNERLRVLPMEGEETYETAYGEFIEPDLFY